MKVRASIFILFIFLGGCVSIHNNTQGTAQVRDCEKTHELLNGVNWVQTSAEYRFACHQAFSNALACVEQGLKDPNWTAAIEQTAGYENLPTAIIVDVDETILDNSPFQAGLVKKNIEFKPEEWKVWVNKKKAMPVPGAKEFITKIRDLGVRVFYVTNRELEAPTVKNLQMVIDRKITAGDVLCKNEQDDWGSDKTSRRMEIAKTHRILLLVGDDYNDFAYLGKVSPAERIKKTLAHQSRWGSKWILIPNPLYGNFEKALYHYDYNKTRAQKLADKYRILRTEE